MKIVNNNAPEALVKLAEKWAAGRKSFYLGPENVFFYNGQPVSYNGADDVSREIGSWSIYSEDCPVPTFEFLKKEEIEDIAYAFVQGSAVPSIAMLTLSYVCNAACHCCSYHGDESAYYKENFKGNLITVDLETTKKWIDKVCVMGIKTVNVGSDGEFFLMPHWKEIMDYTAQKGLKQYIVTNGTGFTSEIVEKLRRWRNVDTIKFSLHATDFETWSEFTQIKNRQLYETAMAAPILAKKAGMTVHLNFVKTKTNARQVKKFIDHWYGKVDGVYISHVLSSEDIFHNHYDQFNEPVGICSAYASMILVSPSGNVTPCCPMTYHYRDEQDSLPRANINNHSGDEILHTLRESMKNEQFRSMCAHCTQYSRKGNKQFKVRIHGYDAWRYPSRIFVDCRKKDVFSRWGRSVRKRTKKMLEVIRR